MAQIVPVGPWLLESGDRMTREEFLARWEQMPELKHAELIDEVVYLPSPVSLLHSSPNGILIGAVQLYVSETPACDCSVDATWMMLKSAPQPDVTLFYKPEHGGSMHVRDHFAVGAPELAIEVTRSTRSYDLGPKLALYQRAGVQEYVAALVEDQRIEWRVLRDGRYELMPADEQGVFRSTIFPGFWIDGPALWRNDRKALFATLNRGLAERS